MDEDGPPPPRRRKFAPKGTVRRNQARRTPPKTGEGNIDGESAEALRLLRQFNDTLGRGGPKVEKKSSVEVSFGPGAQPSGSRRIAITATTLPHFLGGGLTLEIKNFLTRKNLGSLQQTQYDENTRKSAPELGLLGGSEEKKMLFFQFPSNLPLYKQTSSRKGKEKAREMGSLDPSGASNTNWGLEDFPGGYMGKMLVYKSGAIKLKLGDVLYDVSPGSEISFAQDVVAIDQDDKRFCVLGELRKRAVVTPDVECVLSSVIELS